MKNRLYPKERNSLCKVLETVSQEELELKEPELFIITKEKVRWDTT
jgi:hypothetical protein